MKPCAKFAASAVLATLCLARSGTAQTDNATDRFQLGGGLTVGGCRAPNGVVGQAALRVAGRGAVALAVIGAVRGATFPPCPQSRFGPSDESRIGMLVSGALQVRVSATRHVTFFAQAGEATGAWRNLPIHEVTRSAVAIPFAEAGVAVRISRRVSLEVAAMNLRNIYQGDDTTTESVMLVYSLRR